MASTLVLTFHGEPQSGGTFSFDYQNVNAAVPGGTVSFTYVPTRLGNNQIQVASPIPGDPGAASAINFVLYFTIDTSSGLFVASQVGNVVTITGRAGVTFSNVQIGGGITPLELTVNTNNVSSIPEFRILDIEVSRSTTSPCSKVLLTVTTVGDIDNYFYAGTNTPVSPGVTTLEIEHDRDLSFFAEFINHINVAGTETQLIRTPDSRNPIFINGNPSGLPIDRMPIINIPSINDSRVRINVTPTVSGGTVVVTTTGLQTLDLEYSLDNVAYQDSNTFTGQAEGNYTLYIRDQYGCVYSRQFTVTALGLAEPIFEISKANSLSFIKEQTIDNVNVFKNNTNSFDSQDFNKTLYCENTLFIPEDDITIQLKTNYQNLAITLRKENAADVTLTPIKRTSNLGRFQELDCKIYRHSSGRLAIYFENGNVYNQAGVVTGTHSLAGNLPDFAVIGNNINIINFGNFRIFDVILDRTIQKRAILVDTAYTGGIVDGRVQSIFNVLSFEIYEFEIDWSQYGVGLYDVTIVATDPNYTTVNAVSENIDVATEHPDTLAVRYYNNPGNNKDIFYKYGIRHLARVPFLSYVGSSRGETTVNDTDDSTYIVLSTLNETDEISFGEVVKSTMRRLAIALSSENLFVNGIGYSKDGGVTIENTENTNLYIVQATLIDNNTIYTNIDNLDTGVDADYSDLLIPELVNVNGNYLKI